MERIGAHTCFALRAAGRIAIVSIVAPWARGDVADECTREERTMVQTNNRILDEIARLMNDAAGVAQGVRREFDTVFRAQAERVLRDLDVVQREEFEAVKEMAKLAREENEELKARIQALEARLAAPGGSPTPPPPPVPPTVM
jgi:BMFP domain-containing protein YqiC